jgi:HD superfamily phosphohydrolase
MINKKRNITFMNSAKEVINSVFIRRKQLFIDIYYHPKVIKYDRAVICYLLKFINRQEDVYFFAQLNDITFDLILKKYGFTYFGIKQECFHQCENCKSMKLKRDARLSGDTHLNPISLIKFSPQIKDVLN